PMFVIVIVPPDSEAGVVRPARATAVSSAIAPASSRSESVWASGMFGTTSPRSVAAAIPRLTWCLRTIVAPWASSTQLALTSGARGCVHRRRGGGRGDPSRGGLGRGRGDRGAGDGRAGDGRAGDGRAGDRRAGDRGRGGPAAAAAVARAVADQVGLTLAGVVDD